MLRYISTFKLHSSQFRKFKISVEFFIKKDNQLQDPMYKFTL